VDAFSEDLHRYLERRPLLAGPESRLYRAAKFVSRNRIVVLSGTTAFAVFGTLFWLTSTEFGERSSTLAGAETPIWSAWKIRYWLYLPVIMPAYVLVLALCQKLVTGRRETWRRGLADAVAVHALITGLCALHDFVFRTRVKWPAIAPLTAAEFIVGVAGTVLLGATFLRMSLPESFFVTCLFFGALFGALGLSCVGSLVIFELARPI
jgi:hypothetical protein